jgi:NADPH-dependent curcumin reductase CurA
VARPQPGETFVVSAAARSVGSIAGQIAKMQGATVIGITGSQEKCDWVTRDLGFDECIDYKSEDVAARLKEHAPKGVDIFFDNVGGALLDTVLRRLALRARVVLCGDISSYNVDGPPPALHNLRYVMGKRARLEGFNTLDHWDQYEVAAAQLAEWVRDGRIKHREHVLDGLERAPEALVRLFAGDHLGKLVVRVSAES